MVSNKNTHYGDIILNLNYSRQAPGVSFFGASKELVKVFDGVGQATSTARCEEVGKEVGKILQLSVLQTKHLASDSEIFVLTSLTRSKARRCAAIWYPFPTSSTSTCFSLTVFSISVAAEAY